MTRICGARAIGCQLAARKVMRVYQLHAGKKYPISEDIFKLFFIAIYFSRMYRSITAKEVGKHNYITDIMCPVGGQLYRIIYYTNMVYDISLESPWLNPIDQK